MSPWRQRLKWAVYTLLFLDFILYLVQDIESASYTLDARSDLLEVLAAYVTSIDLFWGSKGQILYLWDELFWVLGFRFIDWNIRDWRGWRRRLSVSPSAA